MTSSFLDDLLQIVKLQTKNETDGADVAHVGNLLLHDGKHWKDHGFFRLSAALAALEQEGKAQMFRTANGTLRVRPTQAANSDQSQGRDRLPVVPDRLPFQPLRSAVWFAFAAAAPEQRQLINRRTGHIWPASAPPPAPALDWVPVEPVPSDEQKRWAFAFVETIDAPAYREPLHSTLQQPNWFRVFPVALANIRPGLVRSWSQIRSAGIVEQVRAWATKNNVPEDLLFTRTRPTAVTVPSPVAQEAQTHTQHVRTSTVAPLAPDVRDVLLRAINSMTTDDLLTLSIPAGLLLKAARPDLLK